MRRFLCPAILIAIALSAGCGDNEGKLRTQGRLLKGGESFLANGEEGEFIAVTFVPIPEDGKPPNRFYYAEVDQETGEFVSAGGDKKGMPPGRYRVAIELMKKKEDLFNGRFDATASPFVFDVDEDTEEIVIDLDRPPLYPGKA